MEDLIRKQPGILSTAVGYAGGALENPTHEIVSSGQTGHAESLKIDFDSERVTYRQILDFFFPDPRPVNSEPARQ
jgi:peptide-methionine (S)-S-oxide reductase